MTSYAQVELYATARDVASQENDHPGPPSAVEEVPRSGSKGFLFHAADLFGVLLFARGGRCKWKEDEAYDWEYCMAFFAVVISSQLQPEVRAVPTRAPAILFRD